MNDTTIMRSQKIRNNIVLTGRIAGLVRLTVRLSVPRGLLNSKTDRPSYSETKIGVNRTFYLSTLV